MFYRIVIVKEDTNRKSITLRAKSKNEVEEMIPRIKELLFPNVDTTEYRSVIGTREVEDYSPGTIVPEYKVTIYKPEEIDGELDLEIEDIMAVDSSSWYEDLVEADSEEKAKQKTIEKGCPYPDTAFDECSIYINEISISDLLEETKQSVINRIENEYIDAMLPNMTVREFHQIRKDIEKSEKLQYEAMKYMRSVFAHASALKKSDIDLQKMSAQEYVDFITQTPLLIDDKEAWNKKFEKLKSKYKKGD